MSNKATSALETAEALHDKLVRTITFYEDESCGGSSAEDPYDAWCSVGGHNQMKDALRLVLAVHVPQPSLTDETVVCRSCPTQTYPCLTVKTIDDAIY